MKRPERHEKTEHQAGSVDCQRLMEQKVPVDSWGARLEGQSSCLSFPINSSLFASPFIQRGFSFPAAWRKFKSKDLLQMHASAWSQLPRDPLARRLPRTARDSRSS